jgi:hypothetical protein
MILDGSWMNNADMTVLPDGRRGRIRMYLFDITKTLRDGDFDNRIITHEFGHGVSVRLAGGPSNVLCMDGKEAGGMGEGWGDFWSLVLHWHKSYTEQDVFELGEYVFGRGIRKYPYSPLMSVNPYTFSQLNLYDEVHAVGEVKHHEYCCLNNNGIGLVLDHVRRVLGPVEGIRVRIGLEQGPLTVGECLGTRIECQLSGHAIILGWPEIAAVWSRIFGCT